MNFPRIALCLAGLGFIAAGAAAQAQALDGTLKKIADEKDKTVVTTSGTTSDALIKNNVRTSSISIKSAYGKDHGDSFLQVESGRAAAFVMDDILLAGLVANAKNPADFAVVGEPLKTENYAIMFRKDDPQMKALVDKAVIALFN